MQNPSQALHPRFGGDNSVRRAISAAAAVVSIQPGATRTTWMKAARASKTV
jgi:hypothetical protein